VELALGRGEEEKEKKRKKKSLKGGRKGSGGLFGGWLIVKDLMGQERECVCFYIREKGGDVGRTRA